MIFSFGEGESSLNRSRSGGHPPATPWLSMAVPEVFRFSLRTCSSNRTRRSSVFSTKGANSARSRSRASPTRSWLVTATGTSQE